MFTIVQTSKANSISRTIVPPAPGLKVSSPSSPAGSSTQYSISDSMVLVYQAASVPHTPLFEPSLLSETDPRDLSEAPLDVVLGALIARTREDLFPRRELDQLAFENEGGMVSRAGGLLY